MRAPTAIPSSLIVSLSLSLLPFAAGAEPASYRYFGTPALTGPTTATLQGSVGCVLGPWDERDLTSDAAPDMAHLGVVTIAFDTLPAALEALTTGLCTFLAVPPEQAETTLAALPHGVIEVPRATPATAAPGPELRYAYFWPAEFGAGDIADLDGAVLCVVGPWDPAELATSSRITPSVTAVLHDRLTSAATATLTGACNALALAENDWDTAAALGDRYVRLDK